MQSSNLCIAQKTIIKMKNNHGYVKIIKDCFAYKVDAYNNVIGLIRLFNDEVFPKSGVYNYYRKQNSFWNSTHPEIFVPNLGRFEVNPECYITTEEKANYYENFEDRFMVINDSLECQDTVASILNFIIKLEINPIIIKLLKREKDVS
jgi:hypothetical protein